MRVHVREVGEGVSRKQQGAFLSYQEMNIHSVGLGFKGNSWSLLGFRLAPPSLRAGEFGAIFGSHQTFMARRGVIFYYDNGGGA